MTKPFATVCVLSFLASSGCGPESAEGEPGGEVGTVDEPIIHGTKYSDAQSISTGVVRIALNYATRPSEGCSGTLLTNRWVLTAQHCFCNQQPTFAQSIDVAVQGLIGSGDPVMGPLYKTTAVAVINHPTLDVALVKLAMTLPLPVPPNIYTGNGSELVNQTATTWGYGDDSVDPHDGHEYGFGSYLYSAQETITRIDTDPGNAYVACGGVASAGTLPSTGPWAVGVVGPDLKTRPRIAEGDSGGSLFTGSTSSPTLVGVTRGTELGSAHNSATNLDSYTGLWTIRDWIKQSLPGVPLSSQCSSTALPASTGSGAAAIAEGPDGWVHVVARQADDTIAHWRITFGQVLKVGTIPGAKTTDFMGLGMELDAPSGQALQLGLAFREKTTGKLKYQRWSTTKGWLSAPLDTAIVTPGGPAMTKGGAITFLDANNRPVTMWYRPAKSTFGLRYPVRSDAPAAAPSKRLSVVYDPAFDVTVVGYRTPNNDWIQVTGSDNCSPYFCPADPPYGNAWKSAMLAYGSGQHATIVTSHALTGTGLDVLENRVVYNGSNYPWGGNFQTFVGQPGVAQLVDDIFFVANGLDGSLYLGKADDCFANTF